jgi:uncharacterized membrane protein YfhO
VLTYYYPLWTATSQGQALNIRPADDGAILITIPPAEATVELAFREPRRVEIARVISGFGWLMIAALFAFGPSKNSRFRLRSKQSLTNALAYPNLPTDTLLPTKAAS